MSRIRTLLPAAIMLMLLCGCASTPKRVATEFMNSLRDHKYAVAAELCGVSKDKTSKRLQMTLLEEKYGAKENTVAAFVITSDSTSSDKQNAIVKMNVLYADKHRESGVSLKLRKMNDRWIVQPFE